MNYDKLKSLTVPLPEDIQKEKWAGCTAIRLMVGLHVISCRRAEIGEVILMIISWERLSMTMRGLLRI